MKKGSGMMKSVLKRMGRRWGWTLLGVLYVVLAAIPPHNRLWMDALLLELGVLFLITAGGLE